jgi:hypothetical protein
MGEALGRAGVSIEGGGAWVVDGRGVAHFLFTDGSAARAALENAGIRVIAERDVSSNDSSRRSQVSWANSRDGWPTLASTSRCSTATTITS